MREDDGLVARALPLLQIRDHLGHLRARLDVVPALHPYVVLARVRRRRRRVLVVHVVVVEFDVGEGRLRKVDNLAFLVLQMGEITSSLFLGYLRCLCKTLFLLPFNDLGNALVDLVTTVFL